jgi:hypothetical protein
MLLQATWLLGPGHSHRGRSLSFRLAPGSEDGFIVYSHAGDTVGECKDCVHGRFCGYPESLATSETLSNRHFGRAAPRCPRNLPRRTFTFAARAPAPT